MLLPLVLGKAQFPVNFIQGPLAGVSCASFRELIWQYSQPAFCYSEMISCKTLLYSTSEAIKRYTYISPKEGPVCFQLSAECENELGEAVKKVTDLGASLIDLNCGCPVKKIRSRGAGSKLLMNPQKLYRFIVSMKTNTHLPVSIKIRVEGGGEDKFHQELVEVIKDSGVDFLVVHGRHWTENYDVPCQYEQIKFFVESLNIPVIGNGDIDSLLTLQKMFTTKCAGFMISRASVGRPWLLAMLMHALKNQYYSPPSIYEIGKMLITHVENLIALTNNEASAIFQARKFSKYYAKNITNYETCYFLLKSCKTFIDFKKICEEYFN